MGQGRKELISSQSNSGHLDAGGERWGAFLSPGGFSEGSGRRRVRNVRKRERSMGTIKGQGMLSVERSLETE